MAEPTITVIRRRGQTGEVKEALEMTQEEFDHITSQYSTGRRTFMKATSCFRRISEAQAKARAGEEVKMGNFNSVDTDGFEKAVCLLQYWSEMILREMQKEKNFRIEITYNAEALKTDLFIYTTAKECGTNDTQTGLQEN